MRDPSEVIDELLRLAWWDWPIEKIEANLAALSSGDLAALRLSLKVNDGICCTEKDVAAKMPRTF